MIVFLRTVQKVGSGYKVVRPEQRLEVTNARHAIEQLHAIERHGEHQQIRREVDCGPGRGPAAQTAQHRPPIIGRRRLVARVKAHHGHPARL